MLFGLESFDTSEDWLKMLEDVDEVCDVNGCTALTFHEIKQRMFVTINAEQCMDIIKLNQDADDAILDFIDANPTIVALHSVQDSEYSPRQAAWDAGENNMPYVFCESLTPSE